MIEHPFTLLITANAVAWYGAIIATTSFLISLLNYLRDRVRIKLEESEGFLVYGPQLGNKAQIFIKAINVGRRSVTLSGAGFALKNGKHIAMIRSEIVNLPYELSEGKSVQVYFDKAELLEDVKKENTIITHIFYRAATGKIYKKKVRIS